MNKTKFIDNQAVPPGLLMVTIGIITITILPHIGQYSLPITLIVACCLALKLLSIYQTKFKVTRWWFWPFSLVAASICFYLYGAPSGRDPGIALLIIAAGLKILELKTRRDLRSAMLLVYFLLLSHCLFEHSTLFFMGLLLGLIAPTWVLIQNSRLNTTGQYGQYGQGQGGQPGTTGQDLKLSGKILLQALPFALILFFFIPRLSGAFWLLQTQGNETITGQSDTLKMGALSRLSLSNQTAFKVKFNHDKLPPFGQRYWRGNVFWHTDGRNWQRRVTFDTGRAPIKPLAAIYDYEVTLEPSNQNWLFALDAPLSVPPLAKLSSDYRLTYHQDIARTTRYTLQSAGEYQMLQLSPQQKRYGLQLPDGIISPRMANLLAQWQAYPSKRDIVDAALARFNQQDYFYTLSPPLLTSNNPVDEFLFAKKSGFCEHYASAFVTLMRAAGIPSRIVVGYLGGEYNPISQQMVVRQSDSHAWAEVWLEDSGWTRIDPTAAVAPERIAQTIDLQSSQQQQVGFLSANPRGLDWLARQTRWLQEATKTNWNRWFVYYDKTHQQTLLSNLKLDKLNLELIAVIAFLLALLAINFTELGYSFKNRTKFSALDRSYRRYTKKLRTAGVIKQPHQGPQEFYQLSQKKLPALKHELKGITKQYIALKYGANPTAAQLKTFKQRVRAFKI